ncbi:hypothetical protein TWF694_006072 [Orbilia ellipsospora]|uniref:Uncharacterized protein n=1 Tax=Orbilia ellipsospora TaxID=2528407 RepID=A0AAV9WR41_9PEZI
MKTPYTFVLFSLLGIFVSVNANVIPKIHLNNPNCYFNILPVESAVVQLACDVEVWDLLVPYNIRSSDCAAALKTTVTPPPVTSTSTVTIGSTGTVTTTTTIDRLFVPLSVATLQKRNAPTPTPHGGPAIPTYAAACLNSDHYASACMCLLDVTTAGPTVTAAASTTVVTTTLTKDATKTVTATAGLETWVTFYLQGATAGNHGGEYLSSDDPSDDSIYINVYWSADVAKARPFALLQDTAVLKIIIDSALYDITFVGAMTGSGSGYNPVYADPDASSNSVAPITGQFGNPYFDMISWTPQIPYFVSSPSSPELLASSSQTSQGTVVQFYSISN